MTRKRVVKAGEALLKLTAEQESRVAALVELYPRVYREELRKLGALVGPPDRSMVLHRALEEGIYALEQEAAASGEQQMVRAPSARQAEPFLPGPRNGFVDSEEG